MSKVSLCNKYDDIKLTIQDSDNRKISPHYKGILDIETLFKCSKIISASDISLIYRGHTGPAEIIIKLKNHYIFSLYHEYHVSRLLEDLIGSNFDLTVHSLAVFQSEPPCLLMEQIEGETLNSLFGTLTFEEREEIFHHLLLIIAHIQGIVPFTHNDLHPGNVVVIRTEPRTYNYICYGVSRSIVSKYKLKLIDFDLSYIAGCPPEMMVLSASAIKSGIAPNIFDDFADYAFCITWYTCLCRIYNAKLIKMLEENGFIAFDYTKPPSSNGQPYEGRETFYTDFDGRIIDWDKWDLSD